MGTFGLLQGLGYFFVKCSGPARSGKILLNRHSIKPRRISLVEKQSQEALCIAIDAIDYC